MGDITTIKRALAQQAQSVAEYLLPGGKKEGQEWRAGSVFGDKGKSLGVHLTGNKAGVWSDFDGGQAGDLIDLWCAARGKQLTEALDEIRDWLGIEKPKFAHEPKRIYVRPPKPVCKKPHGRALDYLREARNISEKAIEAYQIGETDGGKIVFPFKLPNGDLAMAKTRDAVSGAKPIPTAKDCEPVCFGWQAIPADAREVVITEGEIDALSMFDYGYPALSVPFGGGGGAKQQWIANDYERFERFERIYLALDMDKPGDEAVVEIAQRLGRHRCLRVLLPRKDANQCLVEGVDHVEIVTAMSDALNLDPEGLRHASHYTDAVINLFHPSENEHQGYHLPYHSVRDKLHFRQGEITLWSGAAGSGKSQLLSDSTVDWIHQGSVVCVSSLEMTAKYLLKRKLKQVLCADRPTEDFIRKAMTWFDGGEHGGGLLIYDRMGKAGIEHLLEVFNYARTRYGADQFVIDSMMRLGIDGDDYTGQERIMFKLVEWVTENNVHLHLVAHARKGSKEHSGVPETDDVKGAMEIGANAFNIVTIFRDRRLEREIEKCTDTKELEELKAKPPVLLNVCKQRNGDFEGMIGLWFDMRTYRYRSAQCSNSRAYIPNWENAETTNLKAIGTTFRRGQ